MTVEPINNSNVVINKVNHPCWKPMNKKTLVMKGHLRHEGRTKSVQGQ